MEHIVGDSRNQMKMRVFCLDEMVSQDSPARQIDKIVSEMDTSYFVKATVKEVGRPPYDPKDMLKLYLYGMDKGILSSRKLEHECKYSIETMWLLSELQPENKTIRNFRRENATHIPRFFNEYVQFLAKNGYIKGELVAIDGTKIRANNSKRNNYSVKKLDRSVLKPIGYSNNNFFFPRTIL